jgi:hypothetical protein
LLFGILGFLVGYVAEVVRIDKLPVEIFWMAEWVCVVVGCCIFW